LENQVRLGLRVGLIMAYPDRPGGRIRRALRRRTSPAVTEVDDAKTRYIREVAAKHPRFTPEEVHAEIHYGRRRRDVTKAMARHVLTRTKEVT
jgi:hypothetical protein